MLRSRELPEAEWPRLDLIDNPPSGSRVVAVENDKGQVVGYWVVLTVVHLEPVWVDPQYRGNATMWRQLWRGIRNILLEAGVKMAVAVVMRDNPATHAIKRLGFQPVNGDLYLAHTHAIISYDRSA